MGNCVGKGEGHVLPGDRHTWIVKYGQRVLKSLLDCENGNLLIFHKKAAALNSAFYSHKNLYNNVFDPAFALPSEQKFIDPKIIEKLGAERKLSRVAAAAAAQSEMPVVTEEVKESQTKEATLPRVQRVSSLREKSSSRKREGLQGSATNLNVYVVTWNMNGKVRTLKSEIGSVQVEPLFSVNFDFPLHLRFSTSMVTSYINLQVQ
jgi:hypothetical protein